jgi:hypothetical protein
LLGCARNFSICNSTCTTSFAVHLRHIRQSSIPSVNTPTASPEDCSCQTLDLFPAWCGKEDHLSVLHRNQDRRRAPRVRRKNGIERLWLESLGELLVHRGTVVIHVAALCCLSILIFVGAVSVSVLYTMGEHETWEQLRSCGVLAVYGGRRCSIARIVDSVHDGLVTSLLLLVSPPCTMRDQDHLSMRRQ